MSKPTIQSSQSLINLSDYENKIKSSLPASQSLTDLNIYPSEHSSLILENDINYFFNILLLGEHDLIDVDDKIYCKKNICIDEKFIRVSIFKHHSLNVSWDKFKSIRDRYYRNLNGCIFVYDITNKESFQNIVDVWYKEYKDYKILKIHNKDNNSKKYDNSNSDSPYYKSLVNYKPTLLILGINTDKRNNSNFKDCVPTDKVVDFAKSIDAEFYELPSVNKKNIGFAIFEMIKKIKINYEASNGKTLQEIHFNKSNCIIN